MNEKNNTFTIFNENGESVECEILFTFDNAETRKSYMIYTDNSRDEEGNIQVFASIYNPEREDQILQPVETEEEWHTIETILDTLQEMIRSEFDNVGSPDDRE